MPDLPQRFKAWEQTAPLGIKDVIRLYESGYAGCVYDPEASDRLASYGYSRAEDALRDYGYEEGGKGQLILPFLHVTKTYPNAYPGPAQKRGSCVAHCNRNAELITLCTEAVSGLPDPVTGYIEEAPKVSPEAERAGVLAIEPVYHYRGHRDDGWWCHAAADVSVRHTGAVVRKDYGFVDLTRLDPQYAGKYWKREQVPAEAYEAFNDNLFRDAAQVDTYEGIRDLLARGIGISSCGSEGFASTRDENGVSKRSGSWAHAMAVSGVDDRPEIHSLYGGPLLLITNSWGRWNTGPRSIYKSPYEIPEGSFWARWRDVKKRSYVAIAGLNGWLRTLLPNWLIWG